MRLGDCLLQADTLLLRQIATNYRLECSLHSKNEMITAILQTFRETSFLESTMERVSDHAIRDAWIQIALSPRGEFSREDMEAIVNRAQNRFPSKRPAPLLPKLLNQGWIYRVGSREALQKYVIPDEIRDVMRKALTAFMQSQVETIQEDPVIWREETGAMLRDITLFLQTCQSSEIKITVDGTIFKKQFASLIQLMEVQETPISGTGWRFGYGRRFHQYPDRFAFLYDYCYLRSFIEEDMEAGVLKVTRAGKEWRDLPEEKRQADLLKAYRLLYRRPIQRLGLIIATIQTVCTGNWVTVESLKSVIAPYLQPYYFDTVDTLFEKRILSMLVHLGVLQHGSLSSGVHVVRTAGTSQLKPDALASEELTSKEPDPILYIQPNFELLVPKESVTAYERDLAEIADLRSADVMRVYRISKTTIVRALRVGWTETALIEFLEAASGGMVPANVKRMIQTWMGEYGKVTLYRTAVMECRTPDVAEEILLLPGVKNEVWGRIGDRHLLIREEAMDHVAQTLERLGYLPDVW